MNKAKPLVWRNHPELDFALGMALGVAAFLLLYGVSTLNVSYDSWIYCGYAEQDIIQRYAGWMFYRAAPWSWPLTVAENLAAPIGTSIVFTDSIPLVAVLCKALSPLLPATFQYFGWYNLLNFALQGGFAMLLLRHFRLGRVFSLLGSVLFLSAPVFVERVFRHDALASQWLVLAALLLYLRARRRTEFPSGSFFALCVLAPAIHSYFVPMVYALLAAALCEYVLRTVRFWKPLFTLAACIGGTLAVSYALGILTRGGGGEAWGYGHYSMNLNALWNPSSLDLYAESGSLGWSRILPQLAQLEGQYDGFAYLGLGLLAAWAGMAVFGAVWLAKALRSKNYTPVKKAGAFLKSHLPLLVVCLLLTLFAFSNVVALGGHTLFTLPLPESVLGLCAVFRASGRMFWPCYYLLLLAPLVFFARVLPRRWPLAALGLLLAVQLWDISPVLRQKYDYFAAGPAEAENSLYASAEWRSWMTEYNRVMELDGLFDYELAAGLIRHNPRMETNLTLANRGEMDSLRFQREETRAALLAGMPPTQGTLYLTRDIGLYGQLLTVLPKGARTAELGGCFLFAAPQ